VSFTWPALLFCADVYVFYTYLVPLRGL
jgi:hypothetical protein